MAFSESLTWFFGIPGLLFWCQACKRTLNTVSQTLEAWRQNINLAKTGQAVQHPKEVNVSLQTWIEQKAPRSSRCVELEIIGCVGFFEISWHCWNYPRSSLQSKANWRTNQWDFQGPLIVGMVWELVWEAYHKGVPVLGAPGTTQTACRADNSITLPGLSWLISCDASVVDLVPGTEEIVPFKL